MKKNIKAPRARKWRIGLIIFTCIMLAIIIILCYNTDGVNMKAVWGLLVPITLLMLFKALLLMPDATGESDYVKELNKHNKN